MNDDVNLRFGERLAVASDRTLHSAFVMLCQVFSYHSIPSPTQKIVNPNPPPDNLRNQRSFSKMASVAVARFLLKQWQPADS